MMITADKKVLVYGGMISRTAETNPEPSSHLFVFKYDSLQVQQKIKLSTDFVNAGANVLLLPDSSILSPGGLSKRISVFTNKLMNPDKCFHWDTRFVPKCKIDASSEMTPAWTVCDMPSCETWLHLFCIGEDAPEVDPWYCKPCRDGKRPPKFWKP